MQIRAEVGEIKKDKTEKFITHKIWSFKNINKIFKPPAQLTKKKRESKRNLNCKREHIAKVTER